MDGLLPEPPVLLPEPPRPVDEGRARVEASIAALREAVLQDLAAPALSEKEMVDDETAQVEATAPVEDTGREEGEQAALHDPALPGTPLCTPRQGVETQAPTPEETALRDNVGEALLRDVAPALAVRPPSPQTSPQPAPAELPSRCPTEETLPEFPFPSDHERAIDLFGKWLGQLGGGLANERIVRASVDAAPALVRPFDLDNEDDVTRECRRMRKQYVMIIRGESSGRLAFLEDDGRGECLVRVVDGSSVAEFLHTRSAGMTVLRGGDATLTLPMRDVLEVSMPGLWNIWSDILHSPALAATTRALVREAISGLEWDRFKTERCLSELLEFVVPFTLAQEENASEFTDAGYCRVELDGRDASVLLRGLQARADLNGQIGRLRRYEASKKRWAVSLVTAPDLRRYLGATRSNRVLTGTGGDLLLRAENMDGFLADSLWQHFGG